LLETTRLCTENNLAERPSNLMKLEQRWKAVTNQNWLLISWL